MAIATRTNMSRETYPMSLEVLDDNAPGFRRHWLARVEQLANSQMSRAGGSHILYVRFFSAEIDAAVSRMSESAARVVFGLARSWGYQPRHEVEYAVRWGAEKSTWSTRRSRVPPLPRFFSCFALGLPILAVILVIRWYLGYEQTTLMSVHSGIAAAFFSLHLLSGMRYVWSSWGLVLLSIFLQPSI